MARPRPLEARPYVAGRLRFGIKVEGVNKAGKRYQRPEAVDYWILTSPHKNLLEQLQGAYGGEITQWNEPRASPPEQWKLTTDSDTLSVWLPADALDTGWEAWVGNQCERRCDTETCWFNANGKRVKMPCVCANEIDEEPTCKPKSRLQVMLPAADLAGVWRLDTQSHEFAVEAPSMIDTIQVLAAMQRITTVNLVLTKRTGVTWVNGKKTQSNYIVPTIQLGNTPEEILSGAAAPAPALEAPRMAELAAWTQPVVHDEIWHQSIDDEIIDAEVVESPVRIKQNEDEDGWDQPPPGVKVRLNPRHKEPGQKRYIRKV